MKEINISAVSYTNTKPFIYGLQHSPVIDKINLSLDTPADCARKLVDDKVDIGLIPVAAILKLSEWHIISDYCIGADGAVNSVFIFSNCEISQVKTLQLDPQSRSSNNLARVLLKHYWKMSPELIKDAADYSQSADKHTAFVQIGDRTFGKAEKYGYVYDLAQVWKDFTGLPFVFAAWVANKPIEAQFITAFNEALKSGLDNRPAVIAALPQHTGFDLTDYLMHKIDFNLTPQKRQALDMFLNFARHLDEHPAIL